MSKSPDAFRTISEVADWLGIPAHVLRFWESKFTQIKPVKRAGGRRYYRPADMLLLGGIKTLLHDNGKSIKEVQAMLRDQGVARVAELSASLESPADPMPVIDTAETVVAFAAPPKPASTQMHMDLESHSNLEPHFGGEDSRPATEAEFQPLPDSEQHPEAELLTTDENVPSVAAQTTVEQTEFNDNADEPASTDEARPQVLTVEDTADDALDVSRAGILALLSRITSLTESSLNEAVICADQLRALTGEQDNLSTN